MFVLLVCDDLFFGSRVSGAAQNSDVELVTDASGSLERLSDPQCAGVILDLDHRSVRPADVAASAREGQTLVAFGPHVRTELFTAAAAAGFATVTRGQLDRSPADVLSQFA